MQSKHKSFIESLVQVGVGFLISYAMTLVILPIFGYNVSMSRGLGITALFTITSLARQYVVRRWFERNYDR